MNTPQEMVEVCSALRDGKKIQRQSFDRHDVWFDELEDDLPNFADMHYRVKPTPKLKRVPLGPEDFPPGTVVRHATEGSGYRTLLQVAESYLRISGTSGALTKYDDGAMFGEWKRLLPGTTEWLPFYREVEA